MIRHFVTLLERFFLDDTDQYGFLSNDLISLPGVDDAERITMMMNSRGIEGRGNGTWPEKKRLTYSVEDEEASSAIRSLRRRLIFSDDE